MLSVLKIPKLIRWVFSAGIIFLLVMLLLRLSFFAYFPKQGNHFSDVLSSFVLGFRYDLRDVSILCLLLLILGSVPVLSPFNGETGRRFCLFIISLASFLLVFFYTVDFPHYSYLSQRLNASVLNYFADAGISASMVWQTYPVIKMILLLIVGTWLIYWLVKVSLNQIIASNQTSTKRSRLAWFLIAPLFFAFSIFGKAGQFPLRWSDAFALGSDYKANLALNPFQSFFSSLSFVHSQPDEAEVRNAFPFIAPYFGFDSHDASKLNFKRTIAPRSGTVTTKPNVVVVICESFSAYKSSMWGNPLNTTPFFNEMCRQGIFFDRCFTPTYGTARGVWAVVTGIPDVESPKSTSSRNPSAVDQHTIINNFNGYSKFYFIGGSTSWANIRGLLTNNISGLNLFEQNDYASPTIDVWGISDKNLFMEANKRLRQETKPFFAIIQTADNHRPYSIQQEDLQEFHKVVVPQDSLMQFGFESNDELNAFRYTDFGYRKFIQAAQNEKYFDNTIFLFIGDHGIPGDVGNMFPRTWTNQKLTAEHVPLLIYAPKLLKPQRISDFCSQVDVLPTLAGLCNIDYENTTLGRDVLDTAHYNKDLAFSFIYSPDEEYIGIIKGDYLYRRQIKGNKEELVSMVKNDQIPAVLQNGDTKKQMQRLTGAVYETAKYMLLNNKK